MGNEITMNSLNNYLRKFYLSFKFYIESSSNISYFNKQNFSFNSQKNLVKLNEDVKFFKLSLCWLMSKYVLKRNTKF